MSIKSELKKNVGKGIDIDFQGGLIFGNGVEGIITRVIEPNFVEIDYCSLGGKKQMVNINNIISFKILNDEDTELLKIPYDRRKKNEERKSFLERIGW